MNILLKQQNVWSARVRQTSPDWVTKAAWLWEAETWITGVEHGKLIRENATHCVVSGPWPRTPHKLEPQQYTSESLISNVWYLPLLICIWRKYLWINEIHSKTSSFIQQKSSREGLNNMFPFTSIWNADSRKEGKLKWIGKAHLLASKKTAKFKLFLQFRILYERQILCK